MAESSGLLGGVRVIESSLLGPGALAMHLAELGADVIKVEPPGQGDYVRKMAWPIVDGISILHWHGNRGKRSVALDLRKSEAIDVYLDLVRGADIVIEAMRPGALARRGITMERMRAVNPAVVFCTLSGYGLTGPYRDLPSHGIAYDAFAGLAPPAVDEEGFAYIPSHTSVGIHAGPLYAALGVLAGVIRARDTGRGCEIEVAQNDAAVAINWLRIEGEKAYLRPEDEVTGNDGGGVGPRRPPGIEGMRDGVRYQYYATTDGHILFMASERAFWKNFCEGIGRPELFEKNPGAVVADHARGNRELRRELRDVFATRSTAAWVRFGMEVNTPIAPVNDAVSIRDDPQFQDRFPWLPAREHGTDMLPSPIKPIGEELPALRMAPVESGRDSDEVLREVLGYDASRIAALREAGALG